jgi:hypothetical protein
VCQNKQSNEAKFRSEAEALEFVLRSMQTSDGTRFICNSSYATAENKEFWEKMESHIKSLPTDSHSGMRELQRRSAGGLSEFLYKRVMKNALLSEASLDWIESAR